MTRLVLGVLILRVVLTNSFAQMSPEELAKHHGLRAVPSDSSSLAGSVAATSGGPGMMCCMGRPLPKQLYPSLMSLPKIGPEDRAQLDRRAQERMSDGLGLMNEGIADLADSVKQGNWEKAHDSGERVRQGVERFQSGIAIERALEEGKSPPTIALDWFKKEMNLSTMVGENRPSVLGMSLFQLIVCLILGLFVAAMIWMYFFKMRRAAILLKSLANPALVDSKSSVPPAAQNPAAPAAPAVPAVATTEPSQKENRGRSARTEVEAAAGARASAPWSGQLRVARIFDETADVKTFRLANPDGGDLLFSFEPGQFMTVAVTVNGKLMRRSYSIASSPCCRGWCEITVKRAPSGVVSGHLHEHVQEGNLLDVVAPSGRFTFRGVEASSVVLIAGGVGITPLMSAIRWLTDQSWSGEIYLIYACAHVKDIIFREELDFLRQRHPNLHVTITLSADDSLAWTGGRGHITKELLTKTVPALASRRVHLCGPPPMIDAVGAFLRELGLPAEQMHSEIFLGPGAHPARATATAGDTSPAASAQATKAAVCTFARSGKTAALPPDSTVLEVSEKVGVNIDYSCRQGYCGTCKVKLLQGKVTMAVEDALDPKEKAEGTILACQAKSDGDVVVDA